MNKILPILAISVIFTAVSPMGINNAFATDTLYGIAFKGSDGPADFYTIDISTGNATFVGSTGFERCSGMDFDASGTLYATCERDDDTPVLISIDPSTGEGTEEEVLNGGSNHSFGDAYADISFRNSDNTLFAYLEAGDGLGTIDITNGDLTELGSTGVDCCGNGMAFTPDDTLYHANEDDLGTLDQALGTQAFVASMDYSPLDSFPRASAMDWNDWTETMYASCNDGFGGEGANYLCTIDLVSGEVTVIGQSVDGLDAIAFAPEDVVAGEFLPIDSTALFLAGLSSSAVWMIPTLAGIAGAGLFVRNPNNIRNVKVILGDYFEQLNKKD